MGSCPSDWAMGVGQRIDQTCLLETGKTQATGIAQAASLSIGLRIVAGPAHASVQTQTVGFLSDLRLAHMLQGA
jgi:hypothetical protein